MQRPLLVKIILCRRAQRMSGIRLPDPQPRGVQYSAAQTAVVFEEARHNALPGTRNREVFL